MTHNIIGSEAGRCGAHVEIRTGRGRRAPKSQVIAAHLVAAGVGAGASLIDVLIGQPFALGAVALAFLLWSFWPSR